MTKEQWEQIKQVFEAALEHPPAERSLFVAQVCREDSALRMEVESLLHGLDQAQNFLAVPAAAALAGASPSPIQHSFVPGDIVSGRFRILRFIGEGGMGEVYEAEDQEIVTKVALKTIRAEIASDQAVLTRFKQELQLTRRVTHANVCRTFDLAHHWIQGFGGAGRDVTYLTMELLEGETLAQRLSRGRLQAEEALPLIRQLADALDAAHSVGVIHRDFKPSNVMLCKANGSGSQVGVVRAVITDFGLARSLAVANNLSSLTHTGNVVGTLAYMAPEQAEGKDPSPATDIYAFGMVIYELLTGIRPFSGGSPISDVIRRMKEAPPSPRMFLPDLDPAWEAVILRCLRVDPRERFSNAGEVANALQKSAGANSPSVFTLLAYRLRKRSLRYALLATVGIALAIAIGIVIRSLTGHESSPSETTLELTKVTADTGLSYQPDVSPDGKMLAYASDRLGNNLNIWLQYVSGGPAIQVTHESFNTYAPSLSSDGSEIAFASDRDQGIYVISSLGGSSRLVAVNGHDPKFSPNDKQILYWTGSPTGDATNPSFRADGKIYLVSARGGAPKSIQEHFADARYPIWLPDGTHVLFQGSQSASGSVLEASDWWIADLKQPDTPPVRTGAFETLLKNSIVPSSESPAWWNNSVIFSARLAGQVVENRNLFQIHLSPETWRVTGNPAHLTAGTALQVMPSISRSGRLFFASASAAANIWALPLRQVVTKSGRNAALVKITSQDSIDTRPSISRDGERLVFLRLEKTRNLWSKDLRTGAENMLLPSNAAGPILSPDGSQVAYLLYEKPKHPIEVFTIGSTAPKRVCVDCGEPMDWSQDGSALLYSAGTPEAIHLLNLGSGETVRLVHGPNNLGPASFSPKGDRIAFVERLTSNRSKLWIAPLHHSAISPAEWIQLTDGQFDDDKPRWSPDGRSIFFVSNRDGFKCLWKFSMDKMEERTLHAPVALLHLHGTSFSLRPLSRSAFDLRVIPDKLIFNAASNTANVWMGDLEKRAPRN